MFVTLRKDIELVLSPGLAPEELPAGLLIGLPNGVAERLISARLAERWKPDPPDTDAAEDQSGDGGPPEAGRKNPKR